MPDARILREIVVALRGLTRRAEEARSPVARDVLTMSAGAVRDIAAGAERQSAPAGPREPVRLPGAN